MPSSLLQRNPAVRCARAVQKLHRVLAPHAHSVIMAGALFCTLAAKYFHAFRCGVTNEYMVWILPDLSVLLGVEAVLALVCFRWRKTWMIRTTTIIAAVICTWSVINAAWIIRMGAQILPTELLPLIRDPLNHLNIIGINLVKMPGAAFALLGPSAVALTFIFVVLAKPAQPSYTHQRLFISRIVAVVLLVILTIPAKSTMAERRKPSQVATSGLQYNSQLKALASMVLPDASPIDKDDLQQAMRDIPTADQMMLPVTSTPVRHPNVVMVILEGVQYAYTSFADPDNDPTPFLRSFAEDGAVFTQMRSTLTHTSKAIFSLLSGRYPSGSQDVVEAVPVNQPYASLATILTRQRGYRTAFFQSARGTFEARPSLVKNLGFDRFWAREHLNDPNQFLGYLGADEFGLLDPLSEWFQADQQPFFTAIMCSATHDPYEVPLWYAEPAKEPIDRYKQGVTYTDAFLKALDDRLHQLGIADNTLVCIVGDHAEAFGEHGKHGHERVAFDEVLRVVWTLRAPAGISAGTRIDRPVSSVDVTPTLLSLLGFDIDAGDFDGLDVLHKTNEQRKVFFSGWVPEGPAGYIEGNNKYVHTPSLQEVLVYDLKRDPLELNGTLLETEQADTVVDTLIQWRKQTLFRPKQDMRGSRVVFDAWLCRWNDRAPVTKCIEEAL